MRINEIFYSLQGEGRWTGTPAVFIRFAGCNMRCDFCDTNHHPYKEYSEEDILREIANFPAKNIIITGGEPTLQLTPSLLDAFRNAGYYIHIETNGMTDLSDEMLCKIDWITCSPKFGLYPKIRRIDELKVVYEKQDLSLYESLPITYKDCRYLQPCDRHDASHNAANLLATINYIKNKPQWKLSLQTQKIINVR